MKILMAEHSHYQSLYRVGCHHLADYFASQGHEVLYLSGPMNIFNLRYFVTGNPSLDDLKYGLTTWIRNGQQEQSNVLSYAPMTLVPIWRGGIFASDWVAHHTLKFTVPNIFRLVRRQGFDKPDVLLVSQPFFAELLKAVQAKIKVYRLTDDIDKFPNIPPSVAKVEREATRQADAVIVTSTPLIDKVKGYGVRDVHYVPNGVDYEHYQQPTSKPSEYKDLQGPIVVYMGAIDTWFDVEILMDCAQTLPHAQFVLIGAPRIDLEAAQSLPNVHCLGRRDYQELPAYLQHADVGIIPFKVTPLIESVSPLKLYEYMACGLPVVASRWRELEAISSPARLASNSEEFLRLLDEILSALPGLDRKRFRQFAYSNSWQERGKQIEAIFVPELQAG